ncbi:hypothetical protein D3C76_1616430 [compost metagenome]
MRSRSSMSDDNTASATNRMMMNLARALSSSTSDLVENMRLRPGPGFKRLNLGAMEPAANSQPPREIGPMMAASTNVIITGWIDHRAICPERIR